jgi:hypothetical protein
LSEEDGDVAVEGEAPPAWKGGLLLFGAKFIDIGVV